MMGYGGYGLLGGFGMGLGVIVWILVMALAVWVIVAFLGRRVAQVEPSPLDILKRRYARGEIAQAEFEQAKRDLI